MAQITLRDVAHAAGVSVSTVSKVVSGQAVTARINALTIDRVREVVQQLGYIPNQTARNLRAQRTGQIGMVLSSLHTPETSVMLTLDGALLMGLSLAAREFHLPAVVVYPRMDGDALLDPTQYLDGRIDGLLVRAIPIQDDPLWHLLSTARMPIVAMWRQSVPPHVGFADIDHRGGAALATQHVLELGHRQIAFLGPTPSDAHHSNIHLVQRHEGYCDTMTSVGIAPRPQWIVHDTAGVLALMQGDDPITAVVAATDLRAATVAAQLAREGIRIPEDLSLVGFDDLVTADLIAGGLTTVYHPIQEMAIQAVRNLVDLINGRPATECRTVLPTHLVVRHSTARLS